LVFFFGGWSKIYLAKKQNVVSPPTNTVAWLLLHHHSNTFYIFGAEKVRTVVLLIYLFSLTFFIFVLSEILNRDSNNKHIEEEKEHRMLKVSVLNSERAFIIH